MTSSKGKYKFNAPNEQSFSPLYDSSNATMTAEETRLLRTFLWQKKQKEAHQTSWLDEDLEEEEMEVDGSDSFFPNLEKEKMSLDASHKKALKALFSYSTAETAGPDAKKRTTEIIKKYPLTATLSTKDALSAISLFLSLLVEMQEARFSSSVGHVAHVAMLLHRECAIARDFLTPYLQFGLSSLPDDTKLLSTDMLSRATELLISYGLPSKQPRMRGTDAQFRGTLSMQKQYAWASNDIAQAATMSNACTLPQQTLYAQQHQHQQMSQMQMQQQQHPQMPHHYPQHQYQPREPREPYRQESQSLVAVPPLVPGDSPYEAAPLKPQIGKSLLASMPVLDPTRPGFDPAIHAPKGINQLTGKAYIRGPYKKKPKH